MVRRAPKPGQTQPTDRGDPRQLSLTFRPVYAASGELRGEVGSVDPLPSSRKRRRAPELEAHAAKVAKIDPLAHPFSGRVRSRRPV